MRSLSKIEKKGTLGQKRGPKSTKRSPRLEGTLMGTVVSQSVSLLGCLRRSPESFNQGRQIWELLYIWPIGMITATSEKGSISRTCGPRAWNDNFPVKACHLPLLEHCRLTTFQSPFSSSVFFWRCGCGCWSLSHFSSPLHLWRSLNWQVWAIHLFPFLFFSEGKITAGEKDHERPAAVKMGKMPLQWMQDAVKLQLERQKKFDHLNSGMMKDYGKIKRSRMWAPPLRSVLCFTLIFLSSYISIHYYTFFHFYPCESIFNIERKTKIG